MLAAALVGAVLLGGLIWLRTSHEQPRRFESCRWEGDTLVLQWLYGANERVGASLDARGGGELTVALAGEVGDGDRVDIGLSGEARFAVYGGRTAVRYEDGTPLKCS